MGRQANCANCEAIMRTIYETVSKGLIPAPGYSVSCVRCHGVVIVTNSGPGYAGLAQFNDSVDYEAIRESILQAEERAN